MARVLEHFAKRGLVPTRWHSVVTDRGALSIDVQMAGLDARDHAFIAQCLRQLPSVEAVLTSTKPAARPAEDAGGHVRVA